MKPKKKLSCLKKATSEKSEVSVNELKSKVLKEAGEQIAEILTKHKLKFVPAITIGESGIQSHISLKFQE